MASKLYNFSPEQLQSLLDSRNTYTEILRVAGINSSSSTNTLKRIIKEYKLDTYILIMKLFTKQKII